VAQNHDLELALTAAAQTGQQDAQSEPLRPSPPAPPTRPNRISLSHTLEPDLVEHKFYAKAVGPVLAITVSGGSDREELLSFDEGS
jgi:hypothetical protein